MNEENLVIEIENFDEEMRQYKLRIKGKMCQKSHPRSTGRKINNIMELVYGIY